MILLCNREAAEAVPKSLRHKVQLFPVNAISAEDLKIISGENGQVIVLVLMSMGLLLEHFHYFCRVPKRSRNQA